MLSDNGLSVENVAVFQNPLDLFGHMQITTFRQTKLAHIPGTSCSKCNYALGYLKTELQRLLMVMALQ